MGRQVPAVARSLDILELFLESGEPLSSSDIVERLAIPRTTAHELLATLHARSYLSRSTADPRRYQLGFRLLQLGSVYAERVSLLDVGRSVATELARDCDETVHVAVREDIDIVYVVKVESTQAVRLASAVGRRLPANCTAIGKVLLASLGEHELDALYAERKRLPGLTPRSITSLRALKQELAEVRRNGFGEDLGESQPDVCCVAAPVRDGDGAVLAAMSISVPASRWSAAGHRRLTALVVAAAARLSQELGSRE